MTDWREFNPGGVIPEGIAELQEAAEVLIAALNSGLEVVGTVLDVAAMAMSTSGDVQELLINAVYDAIDVVIQNLTQTGVYGTFHGPVSPQQSMSPLVWASNVAASIIDWFDSRRPILPTPQYVGGVAIVGVSDTHNGLLAAYNKMFNMFGRFTASISQLGRWPLRADPWVVYEGIGQAPDWVSMKISDVIPALGELADALLEFRDMIAPAVSMRDAYSQFADLLQAKVDALSEWSSRILGILGAIDVMVGWEGAYYLSIDGQFDKNSLQSELINSTGGPMEIENANYTCGMVFLGIGGTGTALLELFGV
jgi:hypothetical protein